MVSGQRSGESGEEGHSRLSTINHLRKLKVKSKNEETHKLKLLPEWKDELETLIRKVVHEVVSQAFHTPVLLQRSEAEPSAVRRYRLLLDCEIPNTVFTLNKIEAKGGEGAQPIKVVLQDAATGAIVSGGPLSSMKLEIVVLQGDFEAEEGTIWTEKEFNENILIAREGKRPLLTSERYVTLKNGVAFIQDLSISDNSSWVRSKKFRLGVKVAPGTSLDVGVQGAVSGAFKVRDRRGETYQKHDTPSLENEVWRLYKIAKDGNHDSRLAANGIHTVKDFLQRYYTDQASLRSILRVSNNMWDVIVQHAKSCTLNNDHYSYYNVEESVGLLFNCVLNVVGVTYDGENYWPLEKLTRVQKSQVERLRVYACANQSQMFPVDVPTNLSPCKSTVPSRTPSLTNLHQLDSQDQPENMNLSYPECPFPYLSKVQYFHNVDATMNGEPIPVSSSISDASTEFYNDEPIWFPNEPASSSGLFPGEDDTFYETSTWISVPPNSGEGSSSFIASTSDSHWYKFSSSQLT